MMKLQMLQRDLYEKSGRIQGRDMQNWPEAEMIVLTRSEKGVKKEKPIRSSKATMKKGK